MSKRKGKGTMGVAYSSLRSGIVCMGLLALCVINIGCKAGAAKNAGFVDANLMKHDANLPFHLSWVKPGLDKTKYTKVYIAPVNTSHMFETTDWQKGERKDQFVADVATLARFTKSAFEKSFKEDPRKRFTVVESDPKSSDTIVIELALIEVVPSKIVLNALGYTPVFFIGTAISVTRAIAQDVSTVAMEARIKDSGTGDTLIMMADREQEQMAVVSVRGLTWYSHAQSIISQWASQFVALSNAKPGELVKDSDPFTLQPW